MNSNDIDNLSIKLEEDDEKDEQNEIKKYGKKKLTKRKSAIFIIISLISIFSIIIVIIGINVDKHSNNVQKEMRRKDNKLNADIERENYLNFLQNENEELKQKLQNLNSIIEEFKFKLNATIQILNATKTDDTTTIIINGLQKLKIHLDEINDSSENFECHKDEEDLKLCLMKLLLCKTALDVAVDELKEKESKIENLENTVKELEEKIYILNTIQSNNERDDEEKDSLYIEKRELSYFINDLRNSNAEYFTYEDYLIWVELNKRRFVIIEGYFNTVVFTRFGFAWSREKGFELS